MSSTVTLKGIPLSEELLEEFGDYVDWQGMSAATLEEVPLSIIKSHLSKHDINYRVYQVAVLKKPSLLEKLLKAGGDPNYNPHYSDWYPMNQCIYYGQVESAKILVDYGFDIKKAEHCIGYCDDNIDRGHMVKKSKDIKKIIIQAVKSKQK